jgi:hypothetical protein
MIDYNTIGNGTPINHAGKSWLVLSNCSKDGYLVATDGESLERIKCTENTRKCSNVEVCELFDKLNNNGIFFCYECMELEPCMTKEEQNIKMEKEKTKTKELHELVDDFFNKIGVILNGE